MKAEAMNCLGFLRVPNTQFKIPVYQRMYDWSKEECRTLFEDIIKVGSNEKAKAHFIGSIVYIQEDTYHHSSVKELVVIDGQQRLTTISLLLAALAQTIESEIISNFSPEQIKEECLINRYKKNDEKYKLILTEQDKDTFISLIDSENYAMPKETSPKITANFEFFKEKLEENKDKLDIICKGIDKLLIIDVSLERGKDDPQLIFESMNSTGKSLSQADLIRNFILMDLEHDEQSKFYTKYWRVMELQFGRYFSKEDKGENKKINFDTFMKHYLTIKNKGTIPTEAKIYEEFKKCFKDRDKEILLQDIQKYANYYCNIALKLEPDKDLKFAIENFSKLDADVVYPFFLEMYDDYKKGDLSKSDFIDIITLTQSYIFRRMICSGTTQGSNKLFATFMKDIDKSNYKESVNLKFCLLQTSAIFPDDTEFKESLKHKNLYKGFSRLYDLLESLENFERKEKIARGEYSIEHIMPQSIENSKEWQRELGEHWQEIYDKYVHTLGNLTLTGYNSEYSNKSFKEKCNIEKGFKTSPLWLNSSVKNVEIWDADSIENRAEILATRATQIWKFPQVSKELIQKAKQEKAQKKRKESYELDEHKFLAQKGKTRELFDALREQILALDDGITQEPLKLYIAYKYDTNFVDIIPQANGLKLSINIYKDELDDPRNFAKDIATIKKGQWGNGNVEVKLDSKEDLSYCVDLIRQALEKQYKE